MTSDDSPARPSGERVPGSTDRSADTIATMAARADFLTLLDGEYHQVVRFVMFNGADQDQALDATQAAFTQAWILVRRRPEQWEAVRDRRAWIRTIALRGYRRPPDRRREPPTVPHADPMEACWNGQDPAELTAQTLYVLQTLRDLPQDVRAVMAFHVDGFRPTDIAAELGITDQQARDLLKKGRKILARLHGPRQEGAADEH